MSNFGRDLLAFHLTPAVLCVYKMLFSERGGQESLLKPFMKVRPNRAMKPLMEFLQKRRRELEDVAFYARMFASMVLVPRNQLIMLCRGRITRSDQETHVNKAVRLFLQGVQIENRKSD